MESEHHSLFAWLECRLGQRYFAFSAVLALGLALLLALAGYADGVSGQYPGAAVWSLGLNPAIIFYIFLVNPVMHRRWQAAMHSLRALAPRTDDVVPPKLASPRGEWIAMLLGSVFGLAVARDTHGGAGWLRLYGVATSAAMFALLAAAIHRSQAHTRQMSGQLRAGLELDVFDAHLLTPFARWGQSLSLVFVGGICLSLLFQSYQSLHSVESVITYGVLIIVSLTLFFISVWTIHVALAKAQRIELARVRRDLAAAREALHRQWADGPPAAVQDRYFAVVVCGIYERQVLDASTWPFNPTIVRQLLASAMAPLSVYVLKLAFGISGGL